jgi:cardiolipin synthase
MAAALVASLLTGCSTHSDPEAANDIRIYQVLPVARKSKLVREDGEGEAIAVINGGTKPHLITGWTVATGSGKVVLPKLTLEPGKVLYLAHSAEYFKNYWSFPPDFEYGVDTDKAVPDLKLPDHKAPILNDNGDIVRLLDDNGALIDILAYGSVTGMPAPWAGPPIAFVNSEPLTPANQVLTRLRDGDKLRLAPTAASFSGGTQSRSERVYFAGQSDFPVAAVTGNMTLTAASAPDNAGPMLFDMVDKAKKSIRIAGHQFGSQVLAEHLVAAVKRGIKVQVAVDRDPGGGDLSEADKALQEKLVKGGVDLLYYFNWDGALSTRFNSLHTEYAMIDDDTVLVGSGNWTEAAFSNDPTCGNREWVAAIKGNPDVVKLFKEVWDFDFSSGGPEVRRFDQRDRALLPDEKTDPGPCFLYTPVKPSPLTVSGQATITRILSPDNTMDRQKGFLGLLHNAKHELLISASSINLWWGAAATGENLTNYPDPYIEEILAAARRGVTVKVLLDPRSTQLGSQRDNQHVVAYLDLMAKIENLKLEARLVNMDGAGIGGTYHNNSLIVDGATVISSMDGQENSFRYARELAIKVEGLSAFTDYYRELFQSDWEASARPNQPWQVMAVPRQGGTFIDWIPNVELDIAAYEVYYKRDTDPDWQKLGTVPGPGFRDEAHEAGTWGVVAVNKAGARSGYALVHR